MKKTCMKRAFQFLVKPIFSFLILFVLSSSTMFSQGECSMTCKGVNMSVDGTSGNCETIIAPSFILTGDILTACTNAVSYGIDLLDHHGELIVSTGPGLGFMDQYMWMTALEYVGQEIQVKIIAYDANGVPVNNCWKNALVEDKLAPVGTCPMDITIKCYERLEMFDIIKKEAFTDCSDFNLVEVGVPLTFGCDPSLPDDLTQRIQLTAYALDVNGMSSEICTVNVDVQRIFPEIMQNVLPIRDELNPLNDKINLVCAASFETNDALSCNNTEDLELVEMNTPDGIMLIPAATKDGGGIPHLEVDIDPDPAVEDIQIVDLYPLESGHPNAQELLASCNIGVSYTDTFLGSFPGSNGCYKKIMRTWIIREWACNGENKLECIQMIEIADTDAPTLVQGASTIFASTNGYTCEATIKIPSVIFEDNCADASEISISVNYPGGFIPNFQSVSQNEMYVDVPVGWDTIYYYASDKCGNTSLTPYKLPIHVVDNTPPVTICDNNIVVSLTDDGDSGVPAFVFDDGSYDDCGLKSVLVRRMTPNDCGCDAPKLDEHFIFLGERGNGNFYYLSKDSLIGPKAFAMANAIGGHVVHIGNNGERVFVRDAVNQVSNINYLIGFSDRDVEGNFRWQSGSTTGYRRWAAGQPNTTVDEGDYVMSMGAADAWRVFDGDAEKKRFVVEINDPCTFSEYVHFCCDDLGEETMIVVRAIDKWGNFNDCMVSADVQNKDVPTLFCPESVTVSCELNVALDDLDDVFGSVVKGDANSAGQFTLTGSGSGADFIGFYQGDRSGDPEHVDADDVSVMNFDNGFANFNCTDELIIEELDPIDERDQCGRGKVYRKFKAYLPGNEVNAIECTQLINFVPTDTFNYETILWPEANPPEFAGCRTRNEAEHFVSPDNSPLNDPAFARPRFPGEDRCDLIGVNYEDEIFAFDKNQSSGYCYKIIRTWSVINWCNLNNSVAGVFEDIEEYQQTFVFTSTENPPVINTNPQNYEVCTFDTDCTRGEETVRAIVRNVTGCGDVCWSYVITPDPSSDVSIFSLPLVDQGDGRRPEFTGDFPVGNHEITWTFTDACGNTDVSTQTIWVGVCKAPTAYCLSTITVSLGAHGNGVEIWATDLAPNVSAPCNADPDQVIVSFDPDMAVANITFDCDDLSDSPVSVPVYFSLVDAKGERHTTFCTSTVILQDSNDMCDGGGVSGGENGGGESSGLISGSISTEVNGMMSEVEVSLNGSGENPVMTDVAGYYAFPAMPYGGAYEIVPSKKDEPDNGVSTLDLVLIQKHILGLGDLDTPYKIIAADVNNDRRITANDLLQLRKIVLGVDMDFSNNEVWRFISDDFTFVDNNDPLSEQFPESYEIYDLESNMDIGFIGIKTGDVNNSVKIEGFSNVEIRSNELVRMGTAIEKVNPGLVDIPVLFTEDTEISGIQFTLEFDTEVLEFNDMYFGDIALSSANFGLHKVQDGLITISWNSSDAKTIQAGQVLFTIQALAHEQIDIAEEITINSSLTKAEAYNSSNETMSITFGSQASASELITLAQNMPNPFSDRTSIQFTLNKSAEVNILFRTIEGKLLNNINGTYSKGLNSIDVDKSNLISSGIVYYTLEVDGHAITKQMIIIN